MFAIVKLGNRQFKVKAGDFIRAPFQNQEQGKSFQIPVLAFGADKTFTFDGESLKKSKVTAVLIRQTLSKKQLVFKKKRRKGYRRTKGHRQKISELKILELKSPDGQISKVEIKSKNKPVKKAESSKTAGTSKTVEVSKKVRISKKAGTKTAEISKKPALKDTKKTAKKASLKQASPKKSPIKKALGKTQKAAVKHTKSDKKKTALKKGD